MANNHLAIPNAELAPILAVIPPPVASMLPDIGAARRWFAEGPAVIARSGQEPHLPPGIRRVIANYKSIMLNPTTLPATAYTSTDHKLAVQGGEITVRSYIPTSSADDARFPLLFWTHGGGT